MQTLSEFDPHLIGAVLNGTATEHSDIHLQLFVDSAKDVELRLIDLAIDFDADEASGEERPLALERLSFVVQAGAAAGRDPTTRGTLVGVHLHVFPRDAIRVGARHRRNVADHQDLHPTEAAGRANLQAVRKLLVQTDRCK
jgi:DNA-binding transcriptional LysR family regulator